MRKLVSGLSLVIFAFIGNQAIGDISYIEPSAMLESACVDTDPVGDGFGWNGSCTCRVDPAYREFGVAMADAGGKLIIGASEAVGTCADSGSASVYQVNTNDAITEKTQELISSGRIAGDAFSAVGMTTNGNVLAVRSVETGNNAVTVYTQSAERWQESAVLRSATDPYSGFGSRMVFVDDYLVAMEYNQLVVYDQNFSIYQTLPADAGQFLDLRKSDQGMIAWRSGSSGDEQDILESYEFETDRFIKAAQIAFTNTLSSYDVEDDLLVANELGPLALNREGLIRTFSRSSNGEWANGVPALQGLGSASDTPTLLDGQLLRVEGTELKIYDLDSTNGWAETQSVVVGSQGASQEVSIAGTGSGQIVIIDRDNSAGINATMKVISQTESSNWQESASYPDLPLSTGFVFGPDLTSANRAGILVNDDVVYAATPDLGVLTVNLNGSTAQTGNQGDTNTDGGMTAVSRDSADASGGGAFSFFLLFIVGLLRTCIRATATIRATARLRSRNRSRPNQL